MANNNAPGYLGTIPEKIYVVHFAQQATVYFLTQLCPIRPSTYQRSVELPVKFYGIL